MTEFTPNVAMQPQMQPMSQRQPMMTPNGQIMYAPPERTLRDEFVHQHKKNGLFERLYNALKNVTKLGTGSKKAQAAIEKAEKGEITEEQARETIQKYRNSQQTSAQILGDAASITAAGAVFFWKRNSLKRKCAEAVINKENILKRSQTEINSIIDFSGKKYLDLSKSNFKLVGRAALWAMGAGALAKWLISKINRIGSKEFKVSKKDYNNLATPMDESMYKMDKKAARKARRRTNFRNFISGGINGLTMPLTTIAGGIVGVPAYLIGNTFNRYFVGTKTDEKKTMKGYGENLKNDAVLHAGLAIATAIPLIKKAQFTAKYDVNLQKAVDKLKNVTLQESEFVGRSTYQELDDILMQSDSISRIIKDKKLTIEQKVEQLSKENIFAVKFKQISGDKSALSRALQEDCPPTRCFLKPDGKWDLTEIQGFVNKNLEGNYQVKQCLGVGTVAETYLAVGPDGKEVCLKVLKKGIDEAKIKADKEKFVNIIKNLDPKVYSQEQKEYFIKNIDDLAEGILKEINFSNESEAAKKLVDSTKVANVVKPIKVQNGIYVMEKANGISLKSLVELNSAYNLKEALENSTKMKDVLFDKIPSESKLGRLLKDVKTDAERLDIVKKYIEKVESRTPQYGDIRLSKDDFNFLIEEYEQVLVEQFYKVDKNGKVSHADIHPGNIFIDINALRNRKTNNFSGITSQFGYRKPAKIFTLIDTGNTVNQTVQQAIDSINLTSYVERGNYKDLAQYVVKGAKGPLSEEEMTKIMEKEFKTLFLDNKTYIGDMTNEKILSIASNIMRKHGVMPADTQLNLNKARHSAGNSLSELIDQLCWMSLKDIDSLGSAFASAGKLAKDAVSMTNKYKRMQAQQEKLNLKQMTLDQIKKYRKNPNMPAKNSEEYLFYKLKQAKEMPEVHFDISEMFQ